MSRRSTSSTERDQIARLLEPLARSGADVPSADVVYWRARARLEIEETDRRRHRILQPLRLFHLTVGAAAITLAALTSLWPLLLPVSPGNAALAGSLMAAALTAGSWFLAETSSPRYAVGSDPSRLG